MKKITITLGEVELKVELRDTPTAEALYKAAPFQATANVWGEEVYFSTPVHIPEEEKAHAVVESGEMAYWPAGNAIALGYGPTPVSKGNEIRLASPCNVFGDTSDDVKKLREVPAGTAISVKIA